MTRTAGRILVLGGARSGKSAYAESLLADAPEVDYLATSQADPDDDEWAARIMRHRERRPAHWRTVETPDLTAALATGGPALLDSITTWLMSAMDAAGSWQPSAGAENTLAAAVDQLVEAWATSRRAVVAVTDEVGGGIVPESAAGRLFRDQLGELNQRLAASADEVWVVIAGIGWQLR